jgi:hypothetical protein
MSGSGSTHIIQYVFYTDIDAKVDKAVIPICKILAMCDDG